MKELDLLLSRFVDRHEAELERGLWPGLEALLALEDDMLWERLQTPPPSAAEHADLLAAIRAPDAH